MKIFPRKQKSNSREVNLSTVINPKLIGINFEQGVQRGIFISRISYFSFLVAVGGLIAQVLLIVYSFGKLPTKIPIFYSMPWGDSVLFASWSIWILPLFNFGFSLINYFLISRVKTDKFLSDALSTIVILICFICFWGTLKIVTLLI